MTGGADSRVQPIVEGHGELGAVRQLLQNAWRHLGGNWLEVLRPMRHNSGSLRKPKELSRVLGHAESTLEGQGFVLPILDAEEDCPKILAPKLVRHAAKSHGHLDFACVLPFPEFETWFAASAESMLAHPGIDQSIVPPPAPEGKVGKKWIDRALGGSYSETVDQARLADRIDFAVADGRSRSMRKLLAELRKRLPTVPADSG